MEQHPDRLSVPMHLPGLAPNAQNSELSTTMKLLCDAPSFRGSIAGAIERKEHLSHLRRLLREYPVVGIVGARQVGKTTLARMLLSSRPGASHVFDLESPADRARLADPLLALQSLRGLIVIDEARQVPALFATLRVLADRSPRPARFLVLGSASPALLQRGAETLAGRIAYYELGGLGMEEVGAGSLDTLWLRGGFPRSFTARSQRESFDWRQRFIATFLERDLPQLGIGVSAETMRRFWTMDVIHAGATTFPLSARIRAVAACRLIEDLKPL